MPDILIRGMEMPDGCHHCRFSYLDEGETNGGEPCTVLMCSAMNQGTNGAEYDGNRPSWCPLVPIPEGHGELIDGHKLYRALFATECGNIAADRDSEGWPKVLTYEAVKKAIQDATIIVPAEGGTDDGN